MTNKMVTVVVPVYNMKELLPKCLSALLNQSYDNYEILIIDDGSTDGSSVICDEYAQKESKIKVIHKENGGLSSARNCGIENATGDFIIFPDPDDWVERNYLEQLVKLANEYHTDLEICGHYVDDAKKSIVHNTLGKIKVIDKKDALCLLMRPDAFCGFAWNKLYHLEIIKKNNLRFDTELGMAQDLHFAFRYIRCCESVVYDPTPTYHYFQHVGGVTNAKSPLTKRKISGLRTYEKIAELAKEEYPQVRNLALSTIFNMSMHFIYIYFYSKMKDKALLKKLKENLKIYKPNFFSDDRYSSVHKLLGRIALISPRLYYLMKKILKG